MSFDSGVKVLGLSVWAEKFVMGSYRSSDVSQCHSCMVGSEDSPLSIVCGTKQPQMEQGFVKPVMVRRATPFIHPSPCSQQAFYL